MSKILCLVMGDQLSHDLSSLQYIKNKEHIVLMCEVKNETDYVPHHKKKIAFLFSAMRHFSSDLEKDGYHVTYKKLDDKNNTGSFKGEILQILKNQDIKEIVVTHPGEYRVLQEIKSLHSEIKIPLQILEDTRYLCSINEFSEFVSDKKNIRMEFFYRHIRKKYNILMDGAEPVGGKWNYDHDNRSVPDVFVDMPEPKKFMPDSVTKDVITLVNKYFPDNFGDLDSFHYAVTREQALKVLDYFIKNNLKLFGTYQDAMLTSQPWMFHSHISFYLNCGLLQAKEVVQKVEEAFYKNKLPLNSVEGFIRQIIGWREFIRGIYWHQMPEYKELNYFKVTRKLPSFYWTANTDMNCIKQCVTDTKNNAYAHHIQRLMVLGNFSLIAGIYPLDVQEWYLAVYADAFEWVELPNVNGMVLFADSGFLSSKPYASSGAYINKMSDYCSGCKYKVDKKSGDQACPFNYLYWDFLARNHSKLNKNQRLSMIYSTYNKMSDDRKKEIKNDSIVFFKKLDNNEKV